MEIGSFIELDLRDTGEYYTGRNVLRLNSGRAGIVHACRQYGVNTLYLPYYQCGSLLDFLQQHGIQLRFYSLNCDMLPDAAINEPDSAFLIVNYFGLIATSVLSSLALRYHRVILDNSQAFYSVPVVGCYQIYSARKFFGVPDGAYVVGPSAITSDFDYPTDCSSPTAAFLLKRLETGCSELYAERMKNEERIDKSPVLLMSKLTQRLLNGVDYDAIARVRVNNLQTVHRLCGSINKIKPLQHVDAYCVPMVYPLVVEDAALVDKLIEKKIYTGRWWNHVLNRVPADSFEAYLSRFMVPVPVDQRYSSNDVSRVIETILKMLE